MSKNLQERTTEPEVFQDMDNFDLLNDSSTFALSLRLQFPKFAKGFTSSDFEPFVKSHVGEDNLVSLGRLSFPNEWQMQVKCKDVRESLIRLGKIKINTRTCWISPLSQSEVRGFIHWIPTAVQNKKLEGLLRAYGEVLLLENQKQKKWSTNVQSDARYFALYLKSGKTADDVPHFIKVQEYYGLITIRGRNPACFHCRELGHRKTECKFFREKLSDYSMRPPGSGKPRFKPRGKRHVPGQQLVPKAKDQAVQTDEVVMEAGNGAVAQTETISQVASVPEDSYQCVVDEAETRDIKACVPETCSIDASAPETGSLESNVQNDSKQVFSVEGVHPKTQVLLASAECKTQVSEEFEQQLINPLMKTFKASDFVKEVSVESDTKKKSIPCDNEANVNSEKESVPKEEESVGDVNLTENNFGVILEQVKDGLGPKDGKPAESKKKRKKRKKKKKDVGVGTCQLQNEPEH